MKWGYESEHDLFVARACFEMLCRSDSVDLAKKMRQQFKDIKNTPILNYVVILIDSILIKDFDLLKEMTEAYEISISRDPSFIEVNLSLIDLCNYST